MVELSKFYQRKSTKRKTSSSSNICCDCEKKYRSEWRRQNKEKDREASMRSYWKRVGRDRKNFPVLSEEDRKARVAARSAKRSDRIKQATPKWNVDLTDLVYQEALHLTQLRNKVTPFRWHVDHIIPLNGKTVCGLHTWNNFQLLPDFVNLEKRNKYEEKELAFYA